MDFYIMDDREKSTREQELFSMLRDSDGEFVPPLSARSSTTQKTLSGRESSEEGLRSYFREMCQQQILGAYEGDVLLGFVSFRENYTSDLIGEEHLPNIYLSTLISKRAFRGRGMTVQMYDHLFNCLYAGRNILTRTWSANYAHTHILERFGFCELHRIPNDRGAGVDTVYYKRLSQFF